MSRTRVLLVVVIAIGSVMGWTVPVMLEQRTVMAYDMYFDESTGFQHVLATYMDFLTQSVIYYQIDTQNKVAHSLVLNDKHVLFYTGLKITGRGNGQTLYAVLEGKYQHENVSDFDQLFTESNDNGQTWSPLSPVPRKYMNDGCQRCGESILTLGNTGRLFIFYRVDCPNAWGC